MFDQPQMQQGKLLGPTNSEASCRSPGKVEMIQKQLDSIIAREEILINRLETLHARLLGPIPADPRNSGLPPTPSGALNELGAVAAVAEERLAQISRILSDLESAI